MFNTKKTIGIVIIGVLGRLIPHVPNVTPLTSLCVFSGSYLSKTQAVMSVLLTLVISDVCLAVIFKYPVVSYFTLFNYTGFLGITLLSGSFCRSKRGIPWYFFMVSISFWVWTNLGVWLLGNLYPKTFVGLGLCYYMALPFLQNALIGDLVWWVIIFGFARVAEFGRRAGFRFQ